MSIQGMVSSRDTTPDPKRGTTDNFVKELLDALAEIMDKKVHLESENLELKHKCQSQKQKIEAFKELALGEKAFLLGIIKRECCSACPGRQDECNQEYPVKEGDDGKPLVDKKVSVGSAMVDKRTSVSSAAHSVHSEHKGSLNIGVGNECCTDCPCPAQNGIAEDAMSIHSKKVSLAPNTTDQQNQTEEIAEIRNLQRMIQQHLTDAKHREETLLSIMQQLEQQMRGLQKRCDCMQNRLNEFQGEQKTLKQKAKQSADRVSLRSAPDRVSLRSAHEKEAQTDKNVTKKVCRCGGLMSQKEEEILSELFFQRF